MIHSGLNEGGFFCQGENASERKGWRIEGERMREMMMLRVVQDLNVGLR
jgi:hypothetical protein